MTVAAGLVPGAEASSADETLAEALEANRQLLELAGALTEEYAMLREQNARLLEWDAEFEKMRADLGPSRLRLRLSFAADFLSSV